MQAALSFLFHHPVDSAPKMVERINNALVRTDRIHHMEGDSEIDRLVPIVADAETGFGGDLEAFELTRGAMRAGAAEDQLPGTEAETEC